MSADKSVCLNGPLADVIMMYFTHTPFRPRPFSGSVVIWRWLRSASYPMPGTVNTWMGDCLRAGLDWIEQGLTSPPTQYRLSGRQFYRSKDPTNSIKVLKQKLASHRPEEAPNPPGASHRVTSEPLKKKNPITVGRAQRDKAPHSRLACTSPV